MEEVLRTNDLVYLGWAEVTLADAGIRSVRLDEHMSAVDGSIGILPRRLLVPTIELARARLVLERAEAELDAGRDPAGA